MPHQMLLLYLHQAAAQTYINFKGIGIDKFANRSHSSQINLSGQTSSYLNMKGKWTIPDSKILNLS